MTTVKYLRDSALAEPWERAIGKLILNFGLLEFESHRWLLQMSKEPDVFPDVWFAQRVMQIRELVEKRAFEADWGNRAARLWGRALDLAKFRNRLAHNPLLFGWTDPTEEGAPDLIGVLDVGGLKNGERVETPWTSRADIAENTNEVATLVEELAALRDTWCSLRDQRLVS